MFIIRVWIHENSQFSSEDVSDSFGLSLSSYKKAWFAINNPMANFLIINQSQIGQKSRLKIALFFTKLTHAVKHHALT